MSLYALDNEHIRPLQRTTFQAEGWKERQDLQRLLQDRIEILDPDLMVLAEEFGHWSDSKRRIDLLAIDREANLVVIELKRTEDGGHMELQALRYASMVARMTFEEAVDAHARWLASKGRDEDAKTAILSFIENAEVEDFGKSVRIVLVSADFSKELTTSVLWLNEGNLDIRCVRLRLYRSAAGLMLDVQQVIPLPEAGDYLVQVRERGRSARVVRESYRDFSRYDVFTEGQWHMAQWKRNVVHLVVRALCTRGVSPEQIAAQIPWKGNGLWRSAEGRLSAEEFAAEMQLAAESGGPAWSPKRWHCGDADLIHANGCTWSLSNQWGGRTIETMNQLREQWPEAGIELRETAA